MSLKSLFSEWTEDSYSVHVQEIDSKEMYKIKKMQEGESRENMPRRRARDLWKEELWKIGPQVGQLAGQSYRTPFAVCFPYSSNM